VGQEVCCRRGAAWPPASLLAGQDPAAACGNPWSGRRPPSPDPLPTFCHRNWVLVPLPPNPAPTSTLTPTPHMHTTGLWRSMRSWPWPCAAPTASAPSRWSASRPDVNPRQPASGAARRPPPLQPHCLLSLAPVAGASFNFRHSLMQRNTAIGTTACMGNSRGSGGER
jgi:hypothetical protein